MELRYNSPILEEQQTVQRFSIESPWRGRDRAPDGFGYSMLLYSLCATERVLMI